MKYFIITFLVIVLISYSCNNQDKTDLGQDPIILKIFTQTEIQSLSNILNLYQAIILTESTEEKDFVKAYRNYLDHLSQYETVAEAYREADISKKNYGEIYDEMISSGLFNELYSTDTIFFNRNSGSKSNLNQTDSIFSVRYKVRKDGKYAKLISELAKSDPVYDLHVKSLHIVGDFPPSIIANLLHNNDEYDLADKKVQLFYILTLLKPL